VGIRDVRDSSRRFKWREGDDYFPLHRPSHNYHDHLLNYTNSFDDLNVVHYPNYFPDCHDHYTNHDHSGDDYNVNHYPDCDRTNNNRDCDQHPERDKHSERDQHGDLHRDPAPKHRDQH
jgi:hypothetical protein